MTAAAAADRTSEGELPSSCCHAELPMVGRWMGTERTARTGACGYIAELRAMELAAVKTQEIERHTQWKARVHGLDGGVLG